MNVEIPAYGVSRALAINWVLAVRLSARCSEVDVRQGRSLWWVCKVSACKAYGKRSITPGPSPGCDALAAQQQASEGPRGLDDGLMALTMSGVRWNRMN